MGNQLICTPAIADRPQSAMQKLSKKWKPVLSATILSATLGLTGCEDMFTIEIEEVQANQPADNNTGDDNKGIPVGGDNGGTPPVVDTPNPTPDNGDGMPMPDNGGAMPDPDTGTPMPAPAPVTPTLNFTDSMSMANEDSGSTTVMLNLSQASQDDVQVNFVAFGQALAGEDYRIVSMTTTIPAGMTNGELTIDIMDDSMAEDSENLLIGLQSATNANLGSGVSHQLTIVDNDAEMGEDMLSVNAFSQTLQPVLLENCSACHVPGNIGNPPFAQQDAQTSHDILLATQKVNLSRPDSSRMIEKLSTEDHFCQRAACDQFVVDIQAAIIEWSMLTMEDEGDIALPAAIITPFLKLSDGEIDESKVRVEDAQIAFFEFKESSGDVAFDTSGVAPAMDLTLTGTEWIGGQGINNTAGKAQADAASSRKLYDMIADPNTGTGEFTVEAWVTPASIDQEGPARIVSYSNGTQQRNFTMGQVQYTYDFRNRNDGGDVGANGTPSLRTDDGDMDLQATLQHVVMTYDAVEGRKVFVNGASTGDVDDLAAGALANWNADYNFLIGNETTDNRVWQGQIFMVAVHNRALTAPQIAQNFDAGFGQRIVLNFDISMHVGQPNTFISLEGRELDGYAYTFAEPTINADGPVNFPIAGITVNVNGEAPAAGQSFKNVSVTVTEPGQIISPLGAVIKQDLGVDADQFSLDFEVLGNKTNIRLEPSFPVPPLSQDVLEFNDTGIRTFAQINETMAVLTGVDAGQNAVRNTYLDLREQLPTTSDINSFVSAHQVGISKLALEYCNSLVDNNQTRNAFFGDLGIDLNQSVAQALPSDTEKAALADYVTSSFLGTGLDSQPTISEIQPDLLQMLNELTAGCGVNMQCNADRTQTLAKATCAAVLGSAAILIQ